MEENLKTIGSAVQIQQESSVKPKEYRNSWFLTDLSDISATILKIGKTYSNNMMLSRRKKVSNPKYLLMLFYGLYLTGSRLGEFLRKPPLFRQMQVDGWTVVNVTKINEKHFTDYTQVGTSEKGRPIYEHSEEHKIITQNIPIDNEAEKEMWSYIFEGNQYGTERRIDFMPLATYEQRTNVTNAFKSNFKTDLTDGEHIYRQAGISPHILRHLRCYSMRFNKGYEEALVQSYLGWSNRDMFEHYNYILKQIKNEEQLRIVKTYLDAKEAKGMIKPKLTDIFSEATQ